MENLKNVAPIEDFNWDAYENGREASLVPARRTRKSLQTVRLTK